MIKYAYIVLPVPLKSEFLYSFDAEKFSSLDKGYRVIVNFNGRKMQGYVIKTVEEKPEVDFEIKSIIRVVDKTPVFDIQEYDLAIWMEKFYFTSRGIALDTMIPGGKRDVVIGGLDADRSEERKDVVLSPAQQQAVDTVINSDRNLFYLFGVTGSGKTEVFLNCAQKVIESGGQVIYLVPEITLTHQLALQVLKRFENNVAILHSGLSDAQRILQWRKIRNGEVSLVIGARSAVFAPCKNLKMIIIDEEHENSYKSGNDPRYHARQVAQKRISDCNGKLLMGSATPSLEAWALMKDPNKIVRLDLTERLGGGSMPKISVSDMKNYDTIFGPQLIDRIHNALANKRQIILFMNRRGYSYYFHCKTCGYEHKCPNCDVAMTYHKKNSVLVCHYCGHREKPIKVCPECGSLDVMYSGFGTEQIEDEIKRLFPSSTVARLDTDTVSKDRKTIQKTLDDFRLRKIDILLGTQMVAKGLNFPNVQLVGLIMADSGLLIPDFRAEERTFDLIVQVSGRSGRSDSSGEVVIQTRMPENPAITYSVTSDVQNFFDRELEIRRQTDFPPFTRMVNIVFRSKNKSLAQSFSQSVANQIRKCKAPVEVFGSQECPIEKVRENYRFQVIVKSKAPSAMMACLNSVLDHIKIPSNVIMEVDVDPLELL